MAQISLKKGTLTTPGAGKMAIGFKSDSKLYSKNESGEEKEIGSGTQIKLFSKTATINQDLEADNTELCIFSTYAAAVAYIESLEDFDPDENEQVWQIMLPGGYIEHIEVRPGIRVSCCDGTIIGKAEFNTTILDPQQVMNLYLSNALVYNLKVNAGCGAALFNSIVLGITVPEDTAIIYANDTKFLNMAQDGSMMDMRYYSFALGIDINLTFAGCENLTGTFSNSQFMYCKYRKAQMINCPRIDINHDIDGTLDVINSDIRISKNNIEQSAILTIKNSNVSLTDVVLKENATVTLIGNTYEQVYNITDEGAVLQCDNVPYDSWHPAIQATGYITTGVGENVTEDNVIEFSEDDTPMSETYTFKVSPDPAEPTHILIGEDLRNTLINITAAINDNSEIVTAEFVEGTETESGSPQINLTAKTLVGFSGNSIELSTNDAALALSGANLQNGGGLYYYITPHSGKVFKIYLDKVPTNHDVWFQQEIIAGSRLSLVVKQNATGDATCQLAVQNDGLILYEGGTGIYVPTQSAEAVDIVELQADGRGNWVVIKINYDVKEYSA